MAGSIAGIISIIGSTALLSAAIIVFLRPLLVHYTLAYPNFRSSHRQPTPQGGGIAVLGAAIIVLVAVFVLKPSLLDGPAQLAGLFFSTIVLAIVGATDDVRPLGVLPRLLLQAVAAFVVVATLPAEVHILPVLPSSIEQLLTVIAIIWFINLANFMDGIDWMTVAEVLPVTAGLIVLALLGALPAPGLVISAALCGAIVGFAPFNRPIARLFLGDVGSLPIGLVFAWLLLLVASAGHLISAIVLPLYYLADATVTLLRRLIHRQPVTRAHRSHYYQLAVDGQFSVLEVVSRVFAVNVMLVILSILMVIFSQFWIQLVGLLVAMTMVGRLLFIFSKSSTRNLH